MPPTDGPALDQGAQVERTGLAWERTVISGLACTLVIAKLIGTSWPVPGVLVAVLGVATTVGVLLRVRRRHRSTDRSFDRSTLPDAKIAATVVGLVVITGLGALLYLGSTLVRGWP